MTPATERSLWRVPVTYGAVGGTQADDLLQYPPRGYRPSERRVRIGHGAARWEHAWVAVMSWELQRRSGIRVRPLISPTEVTVGGYTPVVFDTTGSPITPATVGESGETLYSADGTELLKAGDTAIMRVPLWPFRVPARVVYVVDEPQRRGFAYGTLPGHPERGEEAFIVERRDDDSVWLTIRAFSRPASLLFWIAYPAVRIMQEIYTTRYERALSGPIEGE
ncbi:MAG TPA: DUF1990 domain-containing protein [Pseudolysinimonas sp.]|nr:DUF1990 domain-containing protein [Pseudolysinimonas sp.]